MERAEIERALDAIVQRTKQTLDDTGAAFPYVAEDGTWETTSDGNWCGGHWIGLLRLAASRTDDAVADRFARAAAEHTTSMESGMVRSSMFCGMNFHYAGFLAYDRTGDRTDFARGLVGADAMVAAYHEQARQIPLGTLAVKGPSQFRGPASAHGPSGDRLGAVDAIYTSLPVLWRAFRETGDPRFRDVAVSHADRHLDWYLRDDGRTWHHAEFDPQRGELNRQYNELAVDDTTCWARGLGWNVAGLAACFVETGADRYLSALERSIEYHRANSPDDGVPYWDYEAPAIPDEPRDTSAAGLIAYGLLGLETPRVGGDYGSDHRVRIDTLVAYGHDLLQGIVSNYLVTKPNESQVGTITDGCFNAPGNYATNAELIWTTYYVAVALERLLAMDP